MFLRRITRALFNIPSRKQGACAVLLRVYESFLTPPVQKSLGTLYFPKFYHQIGYAIRNYAESVPTSKTITKCWNCKLSADRENQMVCANCGFLQDVVTKVNYFDLLEVPCKFDLEVQALTRRFRQLQAIVHPDKYSNKSEREQNNSADWSSLINKAYKTLLTPMERGQYLLRLNGMQMPQDNSALDKEFLMEMMERNEEVEDATKEIDLRVLDERIVQELADKMKELTNAFDINDLKVATAVLVKMKYLLSMQLSIKTKLLSLLG